MIVGHELGHVVYHERHDSQWNVYLTGRPKKSPIDEKLRCIQSKHLNSAGVDAESFENEDFADLFGIAVQNELDSTTQSKFALCPYFNPSAFTKVDTLASFYESDGSGHSSDLFRLVSFLTENKNLNGSCKDLVDEINSLQFTETCGDK